MAQLRDELSVEDFNAKWFKAASQDLNPPYKGNLQMWLKERHSCQTNLFLLCKKYLGLDLIDSFYCPAHPIENGPVAIPCRICSRILEPCPGIPTGTSVHREICNTFVHKNPDESIFNQDTKKERLILCSRGSFKSSINRADAAQYIIALPNIRIVIFSASPDLGEIFVKSVKEWFTIQEKDGKYFCDPRFREFQQLFPEHMVPASRKEPASEFTTPARTQSNVEATLMTLPLVGNTAGYHFDVGKWDDSVSDVNCGPNSTEDSRKQVTENIKLKKKLIMLQGYKEYVGTPYTSDDFYSSTLESNRPEVVLIKPCWQVKPESKHKRLEDLQESDVHLLFPVDGKGEPQLTFQALKREALDNFYLFSCQYLCAPEATKTVKFTEQLLMSHIIQPEGLPQAGTYTCFSAWDLAGSASSSADFSVGVVGWFPKTGPLIGRMFVREVVMGRFSPSELEYQVANQAARWRVEGISIEGSPGSFFAETGIMRELVRCGYPDCPRPEFFKLDTRKDAKSSRAASLESLLVNDLLWFSSDIGPIMDTVVKQFVTFKPHSKRKDDIVDAIAHLSRHMPMNLVVPQTEQQVEQAKIDILKDKQLQEMLFPQQVLVNPAELFAPQAPTVWEGARVIRDHSELYGS